MDGTWSSNWSLADAVSVAYNSEDLAVISNRSDFVDIDEGWFVGSWPKSWIQN